mgnify:CR=1 FL=1
MARKTRGHRIFETLLARFEPDIQRAFRAALADLREGVNFRALTDALEAGNIQSAIDALNIEPAAFQRYAVAKTEAYRQSGAATVANISLPGAVDARIRFDMTNPRAEAWIANEVGQKITRITEEQVETVRSTILQGFQRGDGPFDIGVDVAGRVKNGVRQGGVLGLDGPRAERLARVKEGIKTPEGVRGLVIEGRDGTVKMRYRVNKASENAIRAAHRRGEAVPEAQRVRIEQQYSNRLLKDRANTVAQAETSQAVMSAREEAWEQTGVPDEFILKRYIHGGSVDDPREHHIAMNGEIIRGKQTPIPFANGARHRWAHDPEADVSELVNCSCSTEFFVDPQYRPDGG